MSETKFDVDDAEAAYNASRGEPEPGEPAPGDNKKAPDDNPPGFKSFEDYVADGGDPDNYVGKKAYEQQYQRIQDNKGLRDEVKSLRGTVQQTVDASNTIIEQTAERVRSEVEAELLQAKEDEDVNAALVAQQKLDGMDAAKQQRKTQAASQQTGEHDVIADFRGANPILDAGSDQFNADFNTDVEAIFNNFAQKGLTTTDAQIKRALATAVKEAKVLHGDLFESKRNNRKPDQQRARRASPDTAPKAAEGYVIANPRNPRQANAAPEVRDMIRKTAEDGARKAGKDDAAIKKAGDTAATNFEKSLAS